ncbi:thermonuclease family protein [Rhizobium sp. BK251]|uniref:thermonuclease family protein n=1 Tax=Rhizobium sp. BK251 TaxID=2512125 RepID=UPI00104E8EF8|nr:thermonuclease family protein [Rhizobium sp. BK251]TCL73065.1 nuclease-like protein [Rhizobium sp. BK251]
MARSLSILVLLSLLISSAALASDEIEGPVSAEIVRVIDGDTLLVEAMPWPQQTIEVYVRLRDIDAPEIHSRCEEVRNAGLRARDELQQLVAASRQVQLTRISGDKYFGRILADIRTGDGRNPAQDLLSEGYVRPYDGGRKPKVACAGDE